MMSRDDVVFLVEEFLMDVGNYWRSVNEDTGGWGLCYEASEELRDFLLDKGVVASCREVFVCDLSDLSSHCVWYEGDRAWLTPKDYPRPDDLYHHEHYVVLVGKPAEEFHLVPPREPAKVKWIGE